MYDLVVPLQSVACFFFVTAVLPKPAQFFAVAGTRHSPAWLNETGLKYVVYQYVSPHEQHFFENVAHEAGAYIQFIYDYYDCLPKVLLPSHSQKVKHTCGVAYLHRAAGGGVPARA